MAAAQPVSMPRLAAYGVLTWLVPFLVSIPFVGPDGTPRIPEEIFKSIMIVVGSGVGAWLLVAVFRRRPHFGHAGLVVGALWLVINLALDVAILLPLSGMRLGTYVGDIALRYLVIVFMAMAVDAVSRDRRPPGT